MYLYQEGRISENLLLNIENLFKMTITVTALKESALILKTSTYLKYYWLLVKKSNNYKMAEWESTNKSRVDSDCKR